MPAAFDHYAEEYDRHFTNTGIGIAQRLQVLSVLKKHLTPAQKVLELNCGTGEDALWLARVGQDVLATDASSKMIEVAINKVKKNADSLSLHFLQATFEEVLPKTNHQLFHLIFSNFGGLNCIDKETLTKLSADFCKLLLPNGKLILTIMSRNCKWEQMYFQMKGDRQKAFRRKEASGVSTTIYTQTFVTHYYSSVDIADAFKDEFHTISVHPVGLLVPPSYLQPFFEKKRLLLQFLSSIDRLFSGCGLLADHADHFVIVLQKK